MELAQLQRETRSSIELTRNAKGDYQWSVKVYFEEGAQEQAMATAQAIDSQLRRAYVPGEAE